MSKSLKKMSKVSNTVTKEVSVPIYPKLYIYNNNNKVYEWSIEIKPKDDIYTIVTSHGEKDGKMVTHEKDITEGKVKRTVLEQAILEATRKWENKKEKELYLEKLEKNNAKSEVVRPMLANTFSFDLYKKTGKAFKISFPAYVQRKYDGIRCVAYLKDGKVVLESRTGMAFQNLNKLRAELLELFQHMPPNFYFDGELYTDKVDFEVIVGLVRLTEKKLKPGDTDLIDMIEYYIYDFIDMNQKDLSYETRHNYLTTFLSENTTSTSLCKNVETIKVDKLEDVKTYHDQFVQAGYEGIMVRDLNGPYEINKRSKYLQKYKELDDDEFEIIGFHEGTGDEKGAVIWDCKTKEGNSFAARPKGTFESRQKLFQEGEKYIGKKLTVKYQGYTIDNVPRFPTGKGIRDGF